MFGLEACCCYFILFRESTRVALADPGTHWVDQAGFELVASFLPRPPQCWMVFQMCATTPVLLVIINTTYVHLESGQLFYSYLAWKQLEEEVERRGPVIARALLEYKCRDPLPLSRPAAVSLCNSLGSGELSGKWPQRRGTHIERACASPSRTLPV